MKGPKPFRFPSGKTCKELADEYNHSYVYVSRLVCLGYSEEDIIKLFSHKTLAQICREHGVSYQMVRTRLSKGISLEDALSIPSCPRSDRGLDKKTKWWYKGQPLKRVVSPNVLKKIKRRFLKGEGTIEELVEKELNA